MLNNNAEINVFIPLVYSTDTYLFISSSTYLFGSCSRYCYRDVNKTENPFLCEVQILKDNNAGSSALCSVMTLMGGMKERGRELPEGAICTYICAYI